MGKPPTGRLGLRAAPPGHPGRWALSEHVMEGSGLRGYGAMWSAAASPGPVCEKPKDSVSVASETLWGATPRRKKHLCKGKRKKELNFRHKQRRQVRMGVLTSLRKGHLEWMEQVSAVTPPEEKWQNKSSVQEGTAQPWKGRSVRLDTQAACGQGTQDCAAQSRKRQSRCRVPKSPSH